MSPVVASRRFSSVRVLSFLFANLIWLAPLFLAPATNASAQDTFTVSVTTDPATGNAALCPANNAGGSGNCSLRDAITAANADANSAIVDMTGVSGTITVGSNLPQIYTVSGATTAISFNGPGAGSLTVSGAGAYQLFVILYGPGATFQNFTVANGFVNGTGGCTCDPGYGAGIYAYSNVPLTLTNMVITGNIAANGAGGVLAGGPLTVTGTTFSNNSSPSSTGGIAGGLYAIGSPATIYQSTFSGNSAWIGSAIYTYTPVTLTISDSTFANNSNGTEGTVAGSGAIFNDNLSTLTIHDSTFWNNVAAAGAGGALNNAGTMTVTDSIVASPGDSAGTAECYSAFTVNGAGCPATGDGNGNITAPSTINLAPLGHYGGPTATLLPLSGSAAICGGTTAGALNVGGTALTVDQRGFGLDPNCGTGTTDAGSVQVQANGILTVQTANDDPGSTVTTCGPTCTTLRDAINTANTQGTGDIEFANGLSGGKLTLGGILPKIEGAVAINGPSGGFTIDGGNNYEAFWVDGGASLNIANLTVQNASTAKTTSGAFAQGYGGAIFNTSNLTVSNSSFLNNTAGNATGGGQANPSEGGAILNTGSLTIANSNFSGNTASSTPGQGGSGGAITSSGPLTITDSTFSTNTADDGGAIYLDTPNPVILQYDTFSGNVTNNTSFTGAVYNQGLLTVQNSTFAGNTNGGIHSSGYTLNVTNSIFGETSECDPSQSPDCPASGFGNDYATAPVNLSALGNYGGSIPTILPQPGSSAICAGLQADIPSGLTTDQRGFSNATPAAYGCTAGTSDAGSVQTNYMSAQFVGGPYAGNTNSPSITPTVVVSVTEANQNQGGIPVTLTLAGGADTIAAGTGTATSATGVGASFGNLTVDGTGGAYTLSTTIPVVGAYSLSAGPVNLTLTSGPTIVMSPSSLPAATVGAAYSQQMSATGGTPAYTWTETGTLPAGITLTTGGLLHGTPTEAGSFSITITATDSDGFFNRQTYTLTVGPPTIAMTPVAGTLNITTGVAYNQVFTASGGTAQYTYSESGATPTNITWNASTHTLSGTTTDTGSFPITIKVTDNSTGTGSPFSQSFSYTLTVSAPTITITPGTLTAATVGTAFSQQLTAAGGAGPYTYTVTTGTLPAGVTLTASGASAGLLAGTPTAGGSFTFTVTATDSDLNTGAQSYTWTVSAPTVAITPAAGTLNATTNIAYSQVFTATGGTTPYTWTETGTLPVGITWNASTHTLAGTATATGSFPITIKAQDNSTGTGPYSQSNSYALVVGAPTITITPAPLTAATVGVAFSQQLTAAGGTGPYTYAVTTGTLPAGVTLTTGGLLAGTATAGGSFTFTVTATDTNANKGAQSYTWTVNAPTIGITPAAGTLNATENITFTQVFAATGGTTPYTWTETGTLPVGITWNAATATLTGKATATGSFPITIKATDNSTGTGPYSQSNSYTLSVTAPTITITPGTLTAGTVSTAFSQQLTAAGGAGPYTYAVTTGTLPAGGTLSTAGLLAGTPTAGGSFTFTVTATDSNANKGTQPYTWTVNAPTITITPAAGTLNATENITFTQVFAATGGTTPYTWTETGTLPAGITWNAATATLTGKATATGSFPITIKATDTSTGTGPYSQTNSYTLSVTAPTITITPATLTAATVGTAFSQQLTAAGGTGPYTYAVTAGTLPAGVTLTTGGLLAGTATAGGSFTFTVTATDSNLNTGAQAYTWTVNAPTITITPAAGTLNATTNITFTQVFAATGGTPGTGYTWTETGPLPAGITWNAATATLTGKATATGSFPITIKAQDNSTGTGPYSQTNSYTLSVTSPPITITPATLTAGTVGVAFSQQVTAAGGAAPYTYAVTTGTLPAGVTLTTGGLLAGTPTAGGSFTFTVTATDSNLNKGTQAYTWTVNAPTITITPAAGTLNATENITFTQVFAATGGTTPYTWTETGTLPAGITWNAATATLTGKATATGSFPITIKATDTSTGTGPYSQTNSYTLSVTAPTITITPATLTAGTVGVAFSQQLTAAGGAAPYTYAVTTGTLPAGVTLTTGGLLAGTPTAGGSFAFTVTATDSNANKGTQSYTWTVNAPTITITPAAGTLTATGDAAYSQVFAATGGDPPYTWVETGALPAGITWNAATATLSGTPTASGSFPITIKATDSSTGTGPYSQTNSYTLTVTAPTITVTPATLPAASIAVAYSQQLAASGGTGPYTFTETGALPAGITLSTGGLLSGTATAGGSFPITVTAKDANSFTGTKSYTLTVNVATIVITPAAGALTATGETAYSQVFAATGGDSPYTWTETGALPAGITWNAATATLSGTPTASGSFPITIKATDSSGGSGPYSVTNSYTLTVTAPTITITPATLTAAQVAAAYSQQLTASGGTGPYTYTVSTGTLPAGITLSTGGLLSGTPTIAGSFAITVTAKDNDNFAGTQTYTLTVNGPTITILPATLPAASTNVAFTQTFTASGGTSPYTWAETGTLPTGVTFNAATATLSGTPTQSGTFPITIKATDSTTGTGSPFSKSVGYTLAVSAPTITITPTTLPAAAIAVAYSQSVTASGGTAPYTYSVTTGALPAGLTLSTAGAITGTPTAGGSFSFTITAKDSGNFTGTQNYSLTVNAPTITLAPPAGSLTITTNAAFSQTFTASGGTAPYTYTEAGALPAGLTFVNGVLSGTATASGTFPITVTAKDSSTGAGPYSSAAIAYTLNVGTTSISITWANPAAITYGTSLSGILNATVTYNGNPVPGTFSYAATPSGGSASPATAATILAAGSYTLTATFTPTSNAYGTPSPKTVPLTVNQAQPAIAWSPATSIPYGTTLSALLNATASFNSTSVAGSFAYTATPTGGSATAVTGATKLAQGSYTLTATFTPADTTDYKTATATSPLAVTGGTLTVSANNASKVYGTANPTFSGTVTGQQNGDTFTESFTTTATTTSNVGTYPIVPTAAGANLSNYTVVTNDGTLTVTQAGSTTTLAVNSTSVSPGATVTLTATVASATTGTPTGTVSFYDGTTLLNTATLSGGIATYSTTSLATGSSNSMTAVYSGDTNFTGSSTASPIIVTVGGLDFTIAVTPATQTGLSGTTFTYQVAVAPAVAGQPYPGAVTFTATGLPSGATATFSPTSVAAGAGSTTVSMAIATTTSSAAVQPLSTGRKLIPVALAFLLLPLAGTRRMRREGRRFGQMICLLLLALGGIVATAALSGCGSNNGGFGKGGGQGTTYTIAVKATSGSVSHSTTVTLTVQ